MLFLKIILFPVSLLYFFITGVRNFLYDSGILKASNFSIPVICVGNLKAGGTGKTPHVEYLINLLKNKTKVSVISRGYKRKTKGFLLADTILDASHIGDEPYQYFRKFSDIKVAVGEDRSGAIKKVLKLIPETNLVILDDAFQHRAVKAGFNTLLTEYSDPFFKDFLIPSGLLRESRAGASRANAVIVTKCPTELSAEIKKEYTARIKYYSPDSEVYFTFYEYGEPVELFGNFTFSKQTSAVVFAGIANPNPFFKHCTDLVKNCEFEKFSDHHNYSSEEKHRLREKFIKIKNPDKIILTTEKDAVKLLNDNILRDLPVFYVPVTVKFVEKEEEFKQMILDYVGKNNSL